MKNKLTFTFLSLYFALFSLASCGGDDEVIDDVGTFEIANYIVSNVVANDQRNNGNPSDITVSFDGASAANDIEAYIIVGIEASSMANITIEALQSLPDNQFMRVSNTMDSYSIQLSTDLRDLDGMNFELNKEYKFYVMTIGSFMEEDVFALSEVSNTIFYIQKPETRTLVSNFRGNGAITLDDDGNLYVSEFGAGSGNAGLGTSAFKITPEGNVEEFVSNLSGPVGNALDSDGNYYVNNGNEGVSGDFLQIAPDGSQTIIATIPGYPTDILIGQNDDFFIANWTRPILHHVTSDGVVTDFVSDGRLAGCVGITYDDDFNILVGNFSTGKIMSINNAGAITEIATIPTVVEGFVIGYITYFEGNIYATGYGSNIIYKVSLEGNIEELAGSGILGSVDGELDKASFRTPNGIGVDKQRRLLYVSENALGAPTSVRVIPLN